MKAIASFALAVLFAAPVAAQDGCIENVVGRTVCGDDADAVRARINAEQAVKNGTTDEYRSNAEGSSFRSGSVYSNYGTRAFVRGGYIFASRGGGGAVSESAPSIAAGMAFPVSSSGRSHFGLEAEILYLRDSEDLIVLGFPVTATAWGLTGLLGLRWDYVTGAGINPFASAGVGPGYVRLKLDDGFTTVADGDWTFAYSGRAGVAFDISERVSLETAYRYLGSTQSGTPGSHSGELGVNLDF